MSLNRAKSETLTKKNKIANSRCESMPIIKSIIITNINHNKRKLNECNSINIANNNSEPYTKKRKFNENNISNNVNTYTLSESTHSLKNENYELQKQNNKLTKQTHDYKDQAQKWKSKYLELYATLSEIAEIESIDLSTNNNANVINLHKNINNNVNIINNINTTHTVFKPTEQINQNHINTKYNGIKARLLEMGFDKSQIINKLSLYNKSTENAQSVFNELINTFTADNDKQRKLRSYNRRRRKRKRPNFNSNSKICHDSQEEQDADDISSDYITESNDADDESGSDSDSHAKYVKFDNSYCVSVNCHICNKHFDDICKYSSHLEQHYNTDPNKTWRECDFGCNVKAVDNVKFIQHITTHTNDRPYKCIVNVNGIKCGASHASKRYLKAHWRAHFKSKPDSDDSDEQNSNSLSNNVDYNYAELEQSYHVSVHCHVCKKHFDDFTQYKEHLEQHYNNDPHKTWRQCDFGCKISASKPLWVNNVRFIGHIATHTLDKPFKCDVNECKAAFGSKQDFRQHWKRHCNKDNINGANCEQKKVIVPIVIDFEDSYYVSVNCHLCKKFFNSFCEYRDHIRRHYVNDPLRKWLQCDFGCEIDPNRPLYSGSQGFINHIALHTKDPPFKCKLTAKGDKKCKHGYGIKSDLKRHWIVQHKNVNVEEENQRKNKNQNKMREPGEISSSDNCSESESESQIEFESQSESDNNNEFENSYFISVNCHICNEHFSDYHSYKNHIKQHYIKDANRNWKECDFGCLTDDGKPLISYNPSNFIAHIAKHTKNKPFKCNLVRYGTKCANEAGAKGTLRNHWKSLHQKGKKQNKKRKQKK